MQLEQKVIVITGGTSGIGRSMVDKLANDNRIIVLGRNEARLRELENTYPNITTCQCNLAEPGEVEKTADLIVKIALELMH